MNTKQKREFLDSYDVLIDAIEHCAVVRQYDKDEEYQLYINQIKDLKTAIVEQMTSTNCQNDIKKD